MAELRRLINANEAEIRNSTSPNTVTWYRETLSAFERWLVDNGHSTDSDDWDRTVINDYIAFLREVPRRNGKLLSQASVNNHYRALNAFAKRMIECEYIDRDFMRGIKKPKQVRSLKSTLNGDEFQKLVTAARLGQQTLRDEALLLFFLDTGCRREEVRTMLAADVDFDSYFAKVTGKGDKQRFVGFVSHTANALIKYDARTRNQSCPYFFQTETGEQLSENGIYEILRRIGNRAGVDANPHKFRHTFATMALRSGASTLVVQRLMGHTKPDITEHYASLLNADVLDAHQSHSPVNQIRQRRRTA